MYLQRAYELKSSQVGEFMFELADNGFLYVGDVILKERVAAGVIARTNGECYLVINKSGKTKKQREAISKLTKLADKF
ncbi:MAG: hypothetical protein WC548_03310 [Candidatus Pacearchaeota archaeon]